MSASTNGVQLDDETRNQEIVASLRGFLKHQTERVSLYKEFNDAFKEYAAKRMTPEEYATICNIVTQGFVELSVEILALEAHLGGLDHVGAMNSTTATTSTAPATTTNPSSSSTTSVAAENTTVTATVTTTATTTGSSPETRQRVSLNSPEHAQLIREVQLLEKQKLALTVQGQKWFLEREAQEAEDEKEREAEIQADRVMNGRSDEDGVKSDVQATAVHESHPSGQVGGQEHAHESVKLSPAEWQARLDDNRDRLQGIVEEINDKLADIQEAIAVLVL
ncbi:hypothetical protein BGX34_010074 [Mortierella sp. NVP85]|nr:hypothetical protein BGX34_010074 [Mortierella sp. NVP85]